MKRGKLAVVTGPSGVGQDTVLDMFIAKHPNWWLNVSTTTRDEVRPGEVKDKDMHFVSEEEFKQLEKVGKFLETDKSADFWYGTLKDPVENQLAKGTNVFIRPDVKGAMAIKTQYPEAILIFINAESEEVLEQRLRTRHTEDEAEVKRRMEANKEKLSHINEYDHVVINPTGHPEKAVEELEKILF